MECEHTKAIAILTNAYEKGELVLFLGAGVSMPSVLSANMVLAQILDELVKKVKDKNEGWGECYEKILKQNPEGQSCYQNLIAGEKLQFEVFLQHIVEIIGDNALVEILRRFFPTCEQDWDIPPTPALKVIAHALKDGVENDGKLKKIITVNMDSLLEIACENIPFNAPRIVRDDGFSCDCKSGLYKLHGSLETCSQDTYVATLFSEGAGYSQNKQKFLKNIFRNNVVWFLGYSLFDLNMRPFLRLLLKDSDFSFKGLVFNRHDGIELVNVEALKKEVDAQRENGFYTTCSSNDYGIEKSLREVFGYPQTSYACTHSHSPFAPDNPLDGDISEEQAVVLVAKLLGAVGKGGAHVSCPLLDITQSNSNSLISIEALHQAAQSLSASDDKIKRLNKVHNQAKHRLKGSHLSIENLYENMRLQTIFLESLRMQLEITNEAKVKSKIKEFNALVEKAECCYRCHNSTNSIYKNYFKILYYRCLNTRSRFLYRRKITDINREEFQYLKKIEIGEFLLGDLDVMATIFYLKYLLFGNKEVEYKKEAEYIYQLLKNDFKALKNTFREYSNCVVDVFLRTFLYRVCRFIAVFEMLGITATMNR